MDISVCWPLPIVLVGLVLLLTTAVGLARKRDGRGPAMGFLEVEKEFQRLKTQFEAGALTEAQFKARLADLMLQDERGRWWMIGYETGQWYYHDGEKWVRSEPPAAIGRKSRPLARDTKLWLLGLAGLILLALGIVLVAANLGLLS